MQIDASTVNGWIGVGSSLLGLIREWLKVRKENPEFRLSLLKKRTFWVSAGCLIVLGFSLWWLLSSHTGGSTAQKHPATAPAPQQQTPPLPQPKTESSEPSASRPRHKKPVSPPGSTTLGSHNHIDQDSSGNCSPSNIGNGNVTNCYPQQPKEDPELMMLNDVETLSESFNNWWTGSKAKQRERIAANQRYNDAEHLPAADGNRILTDIRQMQWQETLPDYQARYAQRLSDFRIRLQACAPPSVVDDSYVNWLNPRNNAELNMIDDDFSTLVVSCKLAAAKRGKLISAWTDYQQRQLRFLQIQSESH